MKYKIIKRLVSREYNKLRRKQYNILFKHFLVLSILLLNKHLLGNKTT